LPSFYKRNGKTSRQGSKRRRRNKCDVSRRSVGDYHVKESDSDLMKNYGTWNESNREGSGDELSTFHDKLPADIDGYVVEEDTVLVHGIDAVLYHYATNSHRVKMSDLWNGNGCKMTKGTKVCTNLLRWSRHMQLSLRSAKIHSLNSCGKSPLYSNYLRIPWDNYTCEDAEFLSRRTPNPEINFVAEIMRLLAAHWREACLRPEGEVKKKRGRGRPRSVGLSNKKQYRRR